MLKFFTVIYLCTVYFFTSIFCDEQDVAYGKQHAYPYHMQCHLELYKVTSTHTLQ